MCYVPEEAREAYNIEDVRVNPEPEAESPPAFSSTKRLYMNAQQAVGHCSRRSRITRSIGAGMIPSMHGACQVFRGE
jgi:hypothetical protein